MGVAQRRLIDKAVCPERRGGEHGRRWSGAGEVELRHWNVVVNRLDHDVSILMTAVDGAGR
jgi:hypothetical protein